MWYTILIVLIALISILLIGVVLLQSGKGDGLAGMAASGYTTQLLGTRQAPDVLEKATRWLAGVFIVLCMLTTFVRPGNEEARVIQAPATTSSPAPAPKPATPAPAPTGNTAPTGNAAPAPTGNTAPAAQPKPAGN